MSEAGAMAAVAPPPPDEDALAYGLAVQGMFLWLLGALHGGRLPDYVVA